MSNLPPRLAQLRLRDLTLLELVERFGTLGRIALDLHLTQPAVTQALKALEQAFGTHLVTRESRGVRLTPAGTAALAHLRAMAQEAQLAHEAATRPQRPVLTVGCSPMATLAVVPRGLARLRATAPEIQVRLEEADVPTLWQKLGAGHIDALVARRPETAAGESQPGGTESEVVGRERMVVVAPKSLGFAKRPTVADLAQCSWVLPPPGSMVTRAFQAWFASEQLPQPNIAYTSTSFLANLRLAADCGLATIAPEAAAQAQLAGLRLKIVDVSWEGGLTEIVLAYRSSRVADPVLGALRRCFAAGDG